MHKKILIIRFSSIGDIVLTSPVVRCLKEQLEAVEIHYLTKKIFAPIVEANPHISKVITFDKEQNSLSKTIQFLKKEQYHIIVDLHQNLRSWRICKSLKIKALSYDKLNFKRWLLTTFKINKLPNIHLVERYLEAVKPLRIYNDNKGLDYHIPILEYLVPQQLDTRLKSGCYLVFVIGATHFTKRLPSSKIKAICQANPDELIVLIGGKTDLEAANEIEKAGNHIINTCGKLSLHQSASIVDQARLIVAHDTGFMHVAAALKRPIISIWGGTVPEFGMYPYLPSHAPVHQLIENKSISCRPCSKIGRSSCPKGHFDCMNKLDEKEIIKLIKKKA